MVSAIIAFVRIITRYLFKEHLGPLAFGIGLFTLVFLSDKLFQLTDLIVARGVPPFQVGQMLLLILPAIFAETAPIAWLLATLLAYSRMAQDNEIIPLRAAGQSFLVLAQPALWCAAALSVGLTAFNDRILPHANWSFKELYFNILRQRAAIIIQPRAFVSEFDGYIFYTQDKDETSGVMRNIMVHAVRQDQRPVSSIFAKEGRLTFHQPSRRIVLQLKDGEIHEVSAPQKDRYRRITFDTYELDLDVNRALTRDDLTASRSFSEMTYAELLSEIRMRRSTPGLSPIAPAMELHKRIAIPFACLSFSLIGFSFGVLVRRGGRGVGFSLSLFFTLVYYLFLVGGKTLGEKGWTSPWLAAWMPNLLLGAIGGGALWLLSRSQR